MVDINRESTGSALPPELSQEILAKTVENSILMQNGRQVAVPGSGLTIPVITGEPTAAFVAETARKPVSKHTMIRKNLVPKTLAVIEPFSNQFRRDLPGLYTELVRRLPAALGKAFDIAGLFGDRTNVDSLYNEAAASSTNANVQVLDTTDTYNDLLDGIGKIPTGFDDNGFVFSKAGEILVMKAMVAGGPLFLSSAMDSTGLVSIFGRPVRKSAAIEAGTGLDADGSGAGTTSFNALGVAGDWRQAIWGVVESVSIDISDQAVLYVDGGVNDIHLWQQNMFAVRAEVEIGLVYGDPKAFTLYGTTPA